MFIKRRGIQAHIKRLWLPRGSETGILQKGPANSPGPRSSCELAFLQVNIPQGLHMPPSQNISRPRKLPMPENRQPSWNTSCKHPMLFWCWPTDCDACPTSIQRRIDVLYNYRLTLITLTPPTNTTGKITEPEISPLQFTNSIIHSNWCHFHSEKCERPVW